MKLPKYSYGGHLMKNGGKIYYGLLLSTIALCFALFGCENTVQEQPPQNAEVEETDGDGSQPSEGQPKTETEKPPEGANGEEKSAEDNNNETEKSSDNKSENGSSENTDNTVEENTDAPENPPPIVNAAFNFPETKLRESSARRGKIVGTFGKITGGVTPFKYGFQTGDGTNDATNNLFAIDENNNVIINASSLSAGVYPFLLSVTDGLDRLYPIPISLTVYGNAANAEQEHHAVSGIRFAMRYVETETFKVEETVIVDYLTDFWISETEVTQELYEAVMAKNPSRFKNNPAPGETQNKRPVEGMSWVEALVFCNRLSEMTGREPAYAYDGIDDWTGLPDSDINTLDYNRFLDSETADGYRLPGRYEWLWIAIGGKTGNLNGTGYKKRFSGSGDFSWDGVSNYSWLSENSDSITHGVSLKLPNELGLYDVSGNVQEYTCDIRGSIIEFYGMGLDAASKKDDTEGIYSYYIHRAGGSVLDDNPAILGIRLKTKG
jgi:formylglycine-generating enzyme required for sulfatase activity